MELTDEHAYVDAYISSYPTLLQFLYLLDYYVPDFLISTEQ